MIVANTLSVDWAGRRWELLPQRAAVLPETRTVVVADLNLGGDERFCETGALPTGFSDEATLDRLAQVCESAAAESLVILGDLLGGGDLGGLVGPHGSARLVQRLACWRQRLSYLDIFNIRGGAGCDGCDLPTHLGIECHAGPVEDDGVVFAHEPVRREASQVMAGHARPAVMLDGRVGRLRLPCFWFGGGVALLPAFGTHAAMELIRPREGDHVFAVAPGRVADVSQAVAPVSAG